MPQDRSCKGTKPDGSPCGALPRFVDLESGYCAAHDPDKREALREAARKGGQATARRWRGKGLDPDALPDVAGADNVRTAAMRAVQMVVEAVGSGELGDKQGRVMISGITKIAELAEREVWHDLREAIQEWDRTDDPRAVLEVVKGGA